MNMQIIKMLSHEAKVILSTVGSAAVLLLSNSEMLVALISQPWRESLPIILPKLIAGGAVGGSLYNMKAKR